MAIAFEKNHDHPIDISQAGFPFFQLDRFLKILVQEFNESVAISEEFANTSSGKGKSGGLLFNRKVMRIITPGTLIDEKFMNPYENNYLLAISATAAAIDQDLKETSTERATAASDRAVTSGPFGVAWLDLSTGDFYTQTTTAKSLPSVLARIGAREIVLRKREAISTNQDLHGILDPQQHLVTYHRFNDDDLSMAGWTSMLEAAVPPEEQEMFTSEEVTAGSLLLSYVKEKLQGIGMKLQPPIRKQDNETMRIDKNSLRGLEVLETLKERVGGGEGSLLHSVRRTVTKGGTRLLKSWIGTRSLTRFCLVIICVWNTLVGLY